MDNTGPHRFLSALRRVMPSRLILSSEDERAVYECDGLSIYRELPFAVVLPETVAQVQDVLRLASAHQIPVVPRGAGTGLSGGALPHAQGILLVLAKLNRILHIDPLARLATVEPGVRNLQISEAAAPYGLFYAPDPSSQVACTIGGNIAENAGGVHCLKYGLTVHNVQSLVWITADGERVHSGGSGLDGPGLDITSLLIGSEGLLGVVVEATVRLLPRPVETVVILAGFPAVAPAADAVAAIIGAGIVPAGLEMMDNLAIRAAEDYARAGYPVDAAAILLIELDGEACDLEAQLASVSETLRRMGATTIHTARDDSERRRLWSGRKGAFAAVGRLAPDYYCMDGTIPRSRLAHVLAGIESLSRDYRLRVANVFHAGDGNLHPLILFDANDPDELNRALELGGRILELCLAAGGSITGEHGVGVEKLDHMCHQFTPDALRQFQGIKHAFDPARLLNPGKAVPSLTRCAELGGMRVHHGELRFPDLERF
ncbi:MAG: FAD-linked oxidase C-terminal domain-containing protein [Acidiferrobacteraceae bacterium]